MPVVMITFPTGILPGGPALVQSKTTQNGSSSTNTMALTFNNPVGSGHLVVVTIGEANTLGTDTATFADDKGNNYTSAFTTFTVNATTSYGITAAYLANLTNGPQTITVTL